MSSCSNSSFSSDFKESLPLISQAIQDASFVSIDCEMTGLIQSGFESHWMDTPEDRYNKLRQGAMPFNVIQFGLCTFNKKEDSKQYSVHAFNFYIFPRPVNSDATDVRFTCQSSSIDFLINHNFDFNKCFKEGISYMNCDEELHVTKKLEQRHAEAAARDAQRLLSPSRSLHNDLKPGQKQYMQDLRIKITNFVKSSNESLSLDPANAFLRKLTYNLLHGKYPNQIHVQTKTNEKHQQYLLLQKISSKTDVENIEKMRRNSQLGEVQDAVGFAKVIQLLRESEKLIIGHNMLLDLLHMVDKFCAVLPQSYEEFKLLASSVFPQIIDTKVMATLPPLNDIISSSNLSDLLSTVKESPFSSPEIEWADNMDAYGSASSHEHEAAYDAFSTGVCFISMAQYLASKSAENTDDILAHLKPFLNKVNVMRMQDIPFINLDAPDLTPCKNHVFHVTFPSEWKSNDLYQLFFPYGGVQISWVDGTSAFVSLVKKDQASEVLKNLASCTTCRVLKYSEYKAAISDSAAQASKRKMPSSDVDLPKKRRKSSDNNGTSPFNTERSIPTIIEEDEEENRGTAGDQDKEVEEIVENSDAQPKDAKLFEENDSWEQE